jgi:transcriptional regulator with XRE-family HTH domain
MHERIKNLRKDSGLTQAEFGERIGITFSSVSLLEKGKNNPSEQTIRAICSEFNVNRDWLVDGIGDMRASRPLIPELMRVLRTYPALQSALEHVVDVMTPDDWDALNSIAEKVIEQKNK